MPPHAQTKMMSLFVVATVALTAPIQSVAAAGYYRSAVFAGGMTLSGTDSGVATTARFTQPSYLVLIPGTADYYISDTGNHKIRKLTTASATVEDFAGQGGNGLINGTAITAKFDKPAGMAVTSTGNLFIADTGNNVIRTISVATMTVSTFAGNGVSLGKDGTGPAAQFNGPRNVAFSPLTSAILYVADTDSHAIRSAKVSTVEVTTFVGALNAPGFVEGAGGLARLAKHCAIAFTVDGGSAFIADRDNHAVRKVDVALFDVKTYAGAAGSPTLGFQDGVGGSARFNGPQGIAVDISNNVYVTDCGNAVIRKITPDQQVSTIAGMPGTPGIADGADLAMQFDFPVGIDIEASTNNLYVVEYNNHVVRKLTFYISTPTVTGSPTVTGTPTATTTQTGTPTASPTATTTVTRTDTFTPTTTASLTVTPSSTPSTSASDTTTVSGTTTLTTTATPSATATGTRSATVTTTVTSSVTNSTSTTGTSTATPTTSTTATSTLTETATTTTTTAAVTAIQETPSTTSTMWLLPNATPSPTTTMLAPSIVEAGGEARHTAEGFSGVAAVSILAANPAAAQQAIRAKAALTMASRCATVTSRRANTVTAATISSNLTVPPPTPAGSIITTPLPMMSSPPLSPPPSIEGPAQAVSPERPPSFPTALLPILGAIGVDALRSGYRGCILGNVLFVLLVGGLILLAAAVRGPLLQKSSLARGLQLVRWPGSLILPATLAVDGSLTSAFYLLMVGGADGLVALDVALFVAAVAVGAVQMCMMGRWSLWGLRHAVVVLDSDQPASNNVTVLDRAALDQAPSQPPRGRIAYVLYVLLGLNYRWALVKRQQCSSVDGTQSDDDCRETAFAAASVVFQKCHGPLASHGGTTPSSSWSADLRQRWSPFYSAVDFAFLLGAAMLQGAVIASPQDMCVPAVVGLCFINGVSLAISAALRPFLSPAKNVLVLISGAAVFASSVLLLIATLSADDVAVTLLVRSTVVLATLGSAISCVTGVLSLSQRLYGIVFKAGVAGEPRGSRADVKHPPDCTVDPVMHSNRGVNVAFGTHLDQRLLDDADLQRVATTEANAADEGQPLVSNSAAPVAAALTAPLPCTPADGGTSLRWLETGDSSSDGDEKAVTSSLNPTSSSLLREMTESHRPRVVRRTEEGQRRYDELQRLLRTATPTAEERAAPTAEGDDGVDGLLTLVVAPPRHTAGPRRFGPDDL